jgi:hypothetical protein
VGLPGYGTADPSVILHNTLEEVKANAAIMAQRQARAAAAQQANQPTAAASTLPRMHGPRLRHEGL